jgi:hypothetical protein
VINSHLLYQLSYRGSRDGHRPVRGENVSGAPQAVKDEIARRRRPPETRAGRPVVDGAARGRRAFGPRFDP